MLILSIFSATSHFDYLNSMFFLLYVITAGSLENLKSYRILLTIIIQNNLSLGLVFRYQMKIRLNCSVITFSHPKISTIWIINLFQYSNHILIHERFYFTDSFF